MLVARTKLRLTASVMTKSTAEVCPMSSETLLIWLIVGAVAGWLAGVIVKGGGFGIIGNIIVGIIGSLIGGWLFTALQIDAGAGIIGAIAGATVGAVVLLFLIRVLRRAA